jgi:hypothetical protein
MCEEVPHAVKWGAGLAAFGFAGSALLAALPPRFQPMAKPLL